AKKRTGELTSGTRVAIPREVRDPPRRRHIPTRIDLFQAIPESEWARLTCAGPTIARAFEERSDQIRTALRDAGIGHHGYYRQRSSVPLPVAARIPRLLHSLGPDDRLAERGARTGLPRYMSVDRDFAWLLGIYIAEGSRRARQFTISNTEQWVLDRVEAILGRFDFQLYRSSGAITGCSGLFSALLGW